MNYPATYNFPTAYKGDGLIPFTLTLQYDADTPVDLTGSTASMQLRSFDGSVAWEFSSEGQDDHQLTIIPNGVIQFPSINSWDIISGKYDYDLQITDASGFVRTYLRGTWLVNQDITHG
jgi:hypothetical protein